MTLFKFIAYSALILVISALSLIWMDKADSAREDSYAKYDRCVMAEFGISAAQYYQQHGHTANCN